MPKKQEIPTELLNQSAAVLLAARLTAGVSQREVSKRINVTQPLISSWEKGKTIPTINHIVAIEQALQLQAGSLLMAIAYGNQKES